ncbi:MAG: hypothetical protein K2X01_04590 [Cyanobacteria bacterium]|nr:hypothetical protein [Cyanobacteriota bacterium]
MLAPREMRAVDFGWRLVATPAPRFKPPENNMDPLFDWTMFQGIRPKQALEHDTFERVPAQQKQMAHPAVYHPAHPVNLVGTLFGGLNRLLFQPLWN